jgi:hypothetical protein
MVLYEMRRAREVLRFYREFAHACPDELSTMAAFLTAPNGNPVQAVVACHCGASAEGEKAFKPFRTFGPPMTDLVEPVPYVAMQCLFDEGWPPGAPALLEVEFSAHGERRRHRNAGNRRRRRALAHDLNCPPADARRLQPGWSHRNGVCPSRRAALLRDLLGLDRFGRLREKHRLDAGVLGGDATVRGAWRLCQRPG